jgi:signal transduction histidine kinase
MLLEQIFVNLLKNAADAIEEAAPAQPRIRLFVSPVEDPADEGMAVAVTVQDNGVGIPEANLGLIFDLFYTSKPAGKGTGLGLSIVHNILKKLGGEIRVESEPGVGTSFTLILPLHSDLGERDEGPIH